MTAAALYLLGCTLRNRARRLIRQLRSPRYVVAVLIGVAYLGLVLFGQRQGHGGGLSASLLASGGTIFLALLVAKWWLLGADRSALAFSPAEVQFLFTAPVSRAAVLSYKLGRSQLLILFNAILWTVLFGRQPAGDSLVTHLIGLWIFFTTLSLHRLGTALTRDSLLDHGAAGWRRAWPALLVLGLYIAAVAVSMRRLSSPPAPALAWLEALLATPPLRWALLPFHLPLAPLAAGSTGEFLRAVPAAGGLIAMHVLWILRADRRFEEAAVDASARRAELLARWRRQGSAAELRPERSRRRLPLGPAGSPIAAIIWKNHTRLLRAVSPGFLLVLLLLLVALIGAGVTSGADGREILGFAGAVALAWTGMLAVLGPQWVRVDLRGDVDRLDLIRTWPLAGREVMAGMICSSAAVLTGIQLPLGGFGLAALMGQGTIELPTIQVAFLAISGTLVLIGVNFITLGIQNGAALLYPAWVRTEIRPGGVEQMGQHLLTAGASLLLLLVFLLGPTLLGGGLGYLLYPRVGAWGILAGGCVGAAALFLEAFLLVDWLGDRFEAGA